MPVQGCHAANRFACEHLHKTRAINGSIRLALNARQRRERGQYIQTAHRLIAFATGLNATGKPQDPRHPNAPFVQPQLHATQRPRTAERPRRAAVTPQGFRAVVRGEKYQRVIRQLQLVQSRHQFTDSGVHVFHIGKILRLQFVPGHLRIARSHLVGRRHRLVRLMKTGEEKKRLLLIAPVAQPVHAFIDHQLAGVAFHWPHRFAVAHKVTRILVRRRRVVLRSEPVVKPVITRLRLGGRIKFPIAMPLTDVRGVVA